MLEIDILEGARGTGKSTLAFKLRQRTPETTLINFTGFPIDGEEGLVKVDEYYRAWMNFLGAMINHDSKFVFDRFYFSEQVFSTLYKSYEFSPKYLEYNSLLWVLSQTGVKINIFLLTISDREELKQRLLRDKIPFGNVEESVDETLQQQEMYVKLLNDFVNLYQSDNIHVHTIDTTGKNNDEVYDDIVKHKTT